MRRRLARLTPTRLLLPAVVAAMELASCGEPSTRGASDPLPPVMLWAWHGSHELGFLDPQAEGVAFLAGTVTVRGSSVGLQPGAARVDAPPSTALLPVVRIEIDPWPAPELDSEVLELVVSAILGSDVPGAAGLQLDFDATRSQRDFYRRLLGAVRAEIGGRFLSVTALPSWCLGDRWLPDGLTDELVPMLYRMGRDGDLVRRRLAEGREFAPECRSALGLSTDEPVPALDARGRRLYLFSSDRWTGAERRRLLFAAGREAAG